MASTVSLLCLLLLFICVLTNVEGGCKCRPGYKEYAESCYYFSRDRGNFAFANSMCELLGARLAVISSKEENNFLKKTAKKYKGNEYFVGASDMAKEGDWRWYGREKLIYKNWSRKEPNNAGRDEHCLVLNKKRGYEWNDQSCSRSANYICETRT